MAGTCGNARPFVISSARVGRKRGFPYECAHCDICEHYSGDSFCCALVCLCHLDELHGECKCSRHLGNENHSGFTLDEFCHHFSSSIPLLEYPDSNLLYDFCRLAWDVELFLPGGVPIPACLCRDSASGPAASEANDCAFVFYPCRVCRRVCHHQCSLDSRDTNLREATEPPGILAGPSCRPGQRHAPWTRPGPRLHTAHRPHAHASATRRGLHYRRSL